MSGQGRDFFGPTAEGVPFDPTNCDNIDEENVQGAMEDLCGVVATSASPGYSYGRPGNAPNNTWLYRPGSVPSNRTGITVGFTDPVITRVTVANENINTFDITLYEHEGDEINLTSLGTVSVVASRSGEFPVSFAMTQGRQLAVRITSGSAKNVGVDIQLSGSL